MTGLEKWKEEEIAKIEEKNKIEASADIIMQVERCKWCKYHKDKFCIYGDYAKNSICFEGITEYLESEV